MSKSVTVLIATASFSAPAGTVQGGILLSLATPTPLTAKVEKAADGSYSGAFDVTGVPAGSYNLVAQAIDANGAALGEPVSASVTLTEDAPPQVVIDAPASLTITVA